MTTYEQAIEFAVHLHADQFRRHTGEPFIVHPLRVAGRLPQPQFGVIRGSFDDDARVVAVLHDSIDAAHCRLEGTTLVRSQDRLRLSERQAMLLISVTRLPGESDGSFLFRVENGGRNAVDIVVADCEENLADLPDPHPERAAYEAAIKVLRGQRE